MQTSRTLPPGPVKTFVILKVKVNLFLGLAKYQGMKTEGGVNAFLTSALDGCEWSASRSGRFTPRERAPGTNWIAG